MRVHLEIEIDANSFRVTDRMNGTVVMSVHTGNQVIPSSAFDHARQFLHEIVTSYVVRAVMPDVKR